ncbi:MAG: hypothetical protein GY821_11875 [Gammaproteobacteria bacterium]|nr:hypothetical protein [Gammaproteobacteria bacterium]
MKIQLLWRLQKENIQDFLTELKKFSQDIDKLSINSNIKKQGCLILHEIGRLKTGYCLDKIKLLTDMLDTASNAIAFPISKYYRKKLVEFSEKVSGHSTPQTKKIGNYLKIIGDLLAIGAGVVLTGFTAGLGFFPAYACLQCGGIAFFQGAGGLYNARQKPEKGLSKSVKKMGAALEHHTYTSHVIRDQANTDDSFDEFNMDFNQEGEKLIF